MLLTDARKLFLICIQNDVAIGSTTKATNIYQVSKTIRTSFISSVCCILITKFTCLFQLYVSLTKITERK